VKYAICIATISLILAESGTLNAAEQSSRSDDVEYKLKAVCLYNFLKFTTWPGDPSISGDGDKIRDGKDTKAGTHSSLIVIGVVGDDSIAEAFVPLQRKSARDKKIIVRKLGHFETAQGNGSSKAPQVIDGNSLKDYHVLFIASSEKPHTERILATLRSAPVLTVGEADGFLAAGGTINFVNVDNRVQFEISRPSLARAHLVIEPEVFRLARRVIEDE